MQTRHPSIAPERFDAVIFDLDGVVTRTARLHRAAWQAMFDAYLAERSKQRGEDLAPFRGEEDYLRHLDGKPRSEGVRDFLASRGIALPDGSSQDGPDRETIAGLGERKNRLFLDLLERRGVEPYGHAVDLLRRLRADGIRTAVVSASRNARRLLAAAGVGELFDARVDGIDAEELGLAGKPAPDVFLAAAKKLEVPPERTAVIEDARAGVEAGRRGGFGLVIGVDRGDQRDALAKFADVVVKDLAEVRLDASDATSTATLPSALECFARLAERLAGQRPAVFLDYDGTLTPIVDRPERAIISESMRRAVRELAELCDVAIVSGRDRADVEKLAGIDGIWYAGSHGFDIAGPAGEAFEYPDATSFLPDLDRAEDALRERLAGVEGAQVERKKFAVAIHFRRVAPEDRDQVDKAVGEVLEQGGGLRRTGGKMIFELRPDLDWDKGKALRWLLEKLGLDGPGVVPVYLGDDLTDEDALEAITEDGIGILVRDEERPTRAGYALEDPAEVQTFLRLLVTQLRRRGTE